jgi:iron(III) transport system permease protein
LLIYVQPRAEALLWMFLFVPFRSPLKSIMISIWLAYGMRLVPGAPPQVGPELEEATRVCGASGLRVRRDVTLPRSNTA